eukprot:6831814-Prymnesium_polylepis.3
MNWVVGDSNLLLLNKGWVARVRVEILGAKLHAICIHTPGAATTQSARKAQPGREDGRRAVAAYWPAER